MAFYKSSFTLWGLCCWFLWMHAMPNVQASFLEGNGGCKDDDIQGFEKYVRVEMTGLPDKITEKERQVLQWMMIRSYNKSAGYPCVKGFRAIDEAEIVGDIQLNPNKRNHFSIFFRVVGNCQCCEENENLFGDQQHPTTYQDWRDSIVDILRADKKAGVLCRKGNKQAICDCPETPVPVATYVFNQVVQRRREDKIKITNIDSVEMISEVDKEVVFPPIVPVQCSDEEITFFTVVFITIKSTGRVTRDEITELEFAFRRRYNKLTADFCDPGFRRVLEVEVTPVEDGERRELKKTRQRVFRFGVVGSRRGRGRRRLFDDRSGRRLTETGSTCFCPSDPIDERAPTEGEFTIAYNDEIDTLTDVGALKNVVSARNITEPEKYHITTRSKKHTSEDIP